MSQDISMRAADNIRILSAAMVERANSGHPGGPMGGADFIHILYSEFLTYDPNDPTWSHRDRMFLDAGHMSPMLYSMLHLIDRFSMEDLKNFRQWKSHTPGHPEKDFSRGIENTSGPLGQGHTFGVGAAIAERFLASRFGEWLSHKTYIYISDGGVQEEISQGAGRLAGHLGLNHIIMFYDANEIQLSTKVSAVTSEDTARKYEAWGWNVMTINGNDHTEIRNALSMAQGSDKPVLIIGRTIMGKGAMTADGQSFEGKVSTHGQPLSNAGASISKTISGLGGDPEHPFQVFPEVTAYYKEVAQNKSREVAERKAAEAEWEKNNPEKAHQLASFLSPEIPKIDFSQISQKPNSATRNASAAVLSYFADHIDNMIVMSADLANSDKTEAFLHKTHAFTKGDFSGAFLQAGVSELTMAAVCNGMALHGGVIPVCGTFFVFSDYMKPSIRLAALMELPVKYIWTHDAFRVGEDGPTHQPVEQEAQIRLLEHLHNHSGKRSFLALRPADAHETTVCWDIALQHNDVPCGLILSRQNIQDLPAKEGSTRYQDAQGARRGAYIVQDDGGTPELVLVANGSEVATLVEGAHLLRERKQVAVRIVSAPSEGLFRDQTPEYQQSVIPDGVPVFGLTAGLPVTLAGLVGPLGKTFGLDHFGYSANYEVLDEAFGFTGEHVYEQLVAYLQDFHA